MPNKKERNVMTVCHLKVFPSEPEPARILLRVRRSLELLSIILLLAVPAQAQARPLQDHQVSVVDGVTVRRWTYSSDGLKVEGELYLPAGQKKLPLVVFNHDGISGISRQHRLSSVRLAKAGFVVFPPSFRGEDGSEGVVEIAKGEVRDALNALPLLKAHPRVNGSKIAMMGASHGALISVLAASRSQDVKAVVSAYGVMDIYRWYSYLKSSGQLGHDPVTQRTYGQGPEKRPKSFSLRNAVDVVPKLDCPLLLLQGSLDETVPEEQAHIMEKAMKKAGKRVQVEIYPDALHGFLVYAPYLDDASAAEKTQAEQAWRTLVAFLRKELK
jgi:dipeptidyl aminopeptidase/acylaminoacyl peptidase